MEVNDIYKELPVIETKRLTLRKLTQQDLETMFLYCSDEEVAKYVLWDRHQSLKDTKEFMDYALTQYEKGEIAPWGMERKGTNHLIGTIDFVQWNPKHQTAEIGYVLARDQWGNGLITEAALELIRFGFEKMELVRIQAKCFEENTASARVMEKIGMAYEGTFRQAMKVKGKHRNLKVYSILKEEYEKGK
ncbi:N-acetyltransferase [Oceanobacillus piezotolerans]|uniref:N-acetyltransferase n=1 Tax=Oceanobacillus piezotolerans TaxID=2448030 RepID=A0A498DFR7_9BACI|nr:GNAT family protein [Oceanobacillus piezotolerans]RLL46791.1 N-acetyltransferase [Oceanobacillus piezotolerans]